MRFVPVKTPEQQAVLMLHRTRHLFVRQRTMLINAPRQPAFRVRFAQSTQQISNRDTTDGIEGQA